MRATFIAFACVGVPLVAWAQPVTLDPGRVPQLPTIGLPLPSIGLPHPPTGLPATKPSEAEPGSKPPYGDRRGRRAKYGGHPYVLPILMWPVPIAVAPVERESDARASSPLRELGRLRLDTEPAGDTQVFVDGVYYGVSADLEEGIALEPGARTLELRAPGHEPITVALSILANRSTRYRAGLTPTRLSGERVEERHATPTERDAPPAAKVPTTFYEIPGCYLGNVRPEPGDLPGGCDLSRLRTTSR